MVAYSGQMPGHPDQAGCALGGCPVSCRLVCDDHEQFVEDIIVEYVQLLVPSADILGESGVVLLEGPQRIGHHLGSYCPHSGNIHQRLEEGILVEHLRLLRDVHPLVADALQVRDDLQHGKDEAEVLPHGLTHGN